MLSKEAPHGVRAAGTARGEGAQAEVIKQKKTI